MTVAGVYQLPRPIWVSADVLGQRLATQIGPVRAYVVTPQLMSSPGRVGPPQLRGVPAGALGPILGERPAHLDHYPQNAGVIDPEWATEFAGSNPDGATALRAVGVELVGADRSLDTLTIYTALADQLPDVAGRLMERWFAHVARWVSLLTGQDLEHRDQIFDATAVAAGFRTWRNGHWVQGPFTFDFPTNQPVGLQDFGEVLSRVGSETPPQEWLLMLSGSSALDRENLRFAVAEFATAVEICLVRLVENCASSAARPSPRSNLAGWSNWLEKWEPSYTVDPDFAVGLVELRNNVMHKALAPTYDQTRIAYRCALRITTAHGLPRAPWR